MRKTIIAIKNDAELSDLKVYANQATNLYDVEINTDDLTLDISLDKEQMEELIAKLMEVL